MLEEDDTLTLEKAMQIMEAWECAVMNSTVFQGASSSNASMHFVNKHQKNMYMHSANKRQEKTANAKDAYSTLQHQEIARVQGVQMKLGLTASVS